MVKKMKEVSQYWHEGLEWEHYIQSETVFDYKDFDSLALFRGTHPLVMRDRIDRHSINFTFDINKKRLSFKDKMLYHFEKLTGIRLFEFRNYRII